MKMVVLFGDHLAAARRDGAGLATKIATACGQDWGAIDGALTEPCRSALHLPQVSSLLGLLGPSRALNEQVFGVWWGGIADAVAGTAPAHWLTQVSTLFNLLQDRGVHIIAILPPALPFDEACNGYDKSSRRWMRRIKTPFATMCDDMEIQMLDVHGIVDDEMWRDPFTLSSKGYSLLANEVASLIKDATRSNAVGLC